MIVSLIAAKSRNRVIGKDNKLLWNMPNDLAFFKNSTWGMAVIMGRKTFDSIGQKPLKGRCNIVLTSSQRVTEDPAHLVFAQTFEQALEKAKNYGVKEVFVIGGEQIYTIAMPYANYLYLTEIDHDFEGDAFFPDFDASQWEPIKNDKYPQDAKHAFSYSIKILKRKSLA